MNCTPPFNFKTWNSPTNRLTTNYSYNTTRLLSSTSPLPLTPLIPTWALIVLSDLAHQSLQLRLNYELSLRDDLKLLKSTNFEKYHPKLTSTIFLGESEILVTLRMLGIVKIKRTKAKSVYFVGLKGGAFIVKCTDTVEREFFSS